jgi:tetratricopeptide (TPR) repeat protein
MHRTSASCILRCALIVFLSLPATECGGTREPPPVSAQQATKPSLRRVALPEIASASAAVQSQLRAQYASLQSTIESTGRPAADLAAAYGQMGMLLLAAEYLDAAESCLVNARTLQPADMRWPYYLGHLDRFRNDPAKAATWFEETERLQPDHVPTLVWLGEMYLAQNKLDAADPLFRKAVSLDPRSGAARYGLGRVALAKQNYAEAIQNLEQALAIAPKATRIHYPLALAYRGKGDRRNAEAHLEQRGEVEIQAADPLMAALGGLLQNAAAYEVRGAEALDKRQWKEAVTYLRKAIEVAPDNAFTRLNLGTALYLTGDARGALEQLDAAVRLSPGLAKAHYSIGVLMEAAGRDREAIEHFSLAVKSDASYVEARMQLADALRRTGRPAESLPLYADIINTNPGISQALFGHAIALVRLARYQDARDRLAEGVKTYPDQPGFAHALARILAAAPDDRVRDGRRALALTEALWKQQQTVALAETMAMTLAELGRFDEAVSWQRDAIALVKREGRGRSRDLATMTGNLTRYEHQQPCRAPWSADDPIFYPRPAQ